MANNLTISNAFPPWLAHSKTHPVKQHVSLIDRPELYRVLNSGLEKKLSILTSPAGFGKSTLLTQWRKIQRDKGSLVVWLSLDEDDNDASFFALYLAYALASSGLEKDIFDLHPTGFDLNSSSRPILGILLSAIARQDQKIILILDDVEKLEQNTIPKTLDPLINYAPDNLHIVLACRTADNLQLSTLKLQGQVNSITSSELKFTPFEIHEFLGEGLDKKTLSTVNKKTEGWPVALQLIKNSLAGHYGLAKIINNFQGAEQETRNYIFEQILATLPDASKNLLLDASILEHLDPEAIDEIRQTDNSAYLLQELEDLNRLVNPLEDKENQYRLHPLFQEALVYFLEKSNPERMKTLHLRAANMFREKGHIIQSIRHALKAGAPETAAKTLEQAGGILLWNKEGMARIRKAHALLPENIIRKRPRLSLLRALVLLKDGHLNDARHIYDTVRQGLEHKDFIPSPELDYDLAVITATLAVYEGTPLNEKMSDQLASSLESFKTSDKTQTGFVYTILCVFNLQNGDFATAREVGKRAVAHFQKYQSIFGETYIYVHLGVIATAEGDLDKAHEYYNKVQDCQRRYFIDDKDMRLVLNILMAEWHYEKNELVTAARLLGDINHRLETGEAWYEIYAAGYSTLTALTYLQKGLGACLNISDVSIAYIKREGLKRLNRLVVANKIGYLCRAGKNKQARRIVQENNLSFKDYTRPSGTNFSVRECYGVIQALARLLISEKRFDDAITALKNQIKIHQSSYEIRATQKYHLLLAIALFGHGEHHAAFDMLENVLTFVRTRGFLRFILDEDPFIKPLLEAYIKEDSAAERDHGQYLLDLLGEAENPQNNITLSRREGQILDQLAEGYSDKLIARNLDVSENTVRFHLKNLFRKLNVNSRLMAVSEATKHRLLK